MRVGFVANKLSSLAPQGRAISLITAIRFQSGPRTSSRREGYTPRESSNYGSNDRYSSGNRNNYSNRNNSGGRNSYGGRNNGDNNNFSRGRRDGANSYFESKNMGKEQDVSLKNSKFTKIVVVPKEENTTEITLDMLMEENVINSMLHESISRMGFDSLTPVQQKTIKPILENKNIDVITRAKTGTGKTFAFLIPLFEHMLRSKAESQNMVRAVIMAPTRDLALQIEEEVKKIHKNNYALKKFDCMSLVGGTNYSESIRKLRKKRPNIVIATPGRMIATLEEYGNEFFKFVDFKVLDEADRLLEIGFKEDLEHISNTLNNISEIGKDHIRTLMFSATLDDKVQTLANDIMNKDECLFLDTVDKNEPEAHENIDQSVVISNHFAQSIYATIEHLKKKTAEDPNYKAILFAPTVKLTKFVSDIIQKELDRSFQVYEFHGKVDQRRRTNLVRIFKSVNAGLLVCTDVGARGMDFPNVTEVLQLGVPTELSNYIHRIGRTARAGKEGASIMFLCKDELPFIDVLSRTKNIVIENQSEYEPSQEIVDEVSKIIHSKEELAEVIFSVLSCYRACATEYNFNQRKITPELTSTYGFLLNDPELKIPIYSRSFLEKMGYSRHPMLNEMFDLQGDAAGIFRSAGPNRFGSSSPRNYGGNGNRNRSNYNDKNGSINSGYRRNSYQNKPGYTSRFESSD